MADDDNSNLLGSASSDQGGEETIPSGGETGSGTSDHDQGTGDAGGNPAKQTPAPDKSTSDDDGSALIAALAAGDMDAVDSDGEVRKPADAAKKPDPVKDEAEETPKAEEPDKAKDDPDQHLSDEEKDEIAKAPKGYRTRLKDLLKERAEQRTAIEQVKSEAESLKPVKQFTDALIKHAMEAGLVETRDGKTDTSGLRDLIEQERLLKGKSPKEQAQYFRDLANDMDPDGKPVTLPQDLKELVELGSLPEDDAMAIARKREAKASAPDNERRQREANAARQAEQAKADQSRAFQQAQQTGFNEINQVSKDYQTRFGAEWPAIGKLVEAELGPLLKDTAPTAWKALAKTVVESVVARRKAVPLKKPSTSPAPVAAPAKRSGDVMSEEDELRALSAGKL